MAKRKKSNDDKVVKGLKAMLDEQRAQHAVDMAHLAGALMAAKREPDRDRTKVLLSVTEDDLKTIDARAVAAGMNRSAYLVAMGRAGSAGVLDAIHRLSVELQRFERDAGWQKEIDALNEKLEDRRLYLAQAIDTLSATTDAFEGVGELDATARRLMSQSLRVIKSMLEEAVSVPA